MDDASEPGAGAVSTSDPVIDPTKNVLDLVAAEGRRQDELRQAAEKLSNAEHRHAEEKAALRAAYEEKLRLAEANRLDAIRAVDVAAATLREERASAAASVLANQVVVTASTLRDLVASTAATASTAAAAVTNPLAERISQLERSSYEGTGKSAVADPQLARMAETIERLSASMSEGQGGKASRTDSRASVALIATLVGLAISFVMLAAVIAIAALRGAG